MSEKLSSPKELAEKVVSARGGRRGRSVGFHHDMATMEAAIVARDAEIVKMVEEQKEGMMRSSPFPGVDVGLRVCDGILAALNPSPPAATTP